MLFAIAFTLVMASCGQKSVQVAPTTDSTKVDTAKVVTPVDTTTVKDTLK